CWTSLPPLAPCPIRCVRAGAPARVEAISSALTRLLEPAPESYESLTAGSSAARYIRSGGVLYTYETDASLAGAQWGLELRRRRGIEFEVLHGAELHRFEPALAPAVKHGGLYRAPKFCTHPTPTAPPPPHPSPPPVP